MDSEPMFLLQAFQGSLIVTTNEFWQRDEETFENDDLGDERVMMFQLIGVPGINQRAREVLPF